MASSYEEVEFVAEWLEQQMVESHLSHDHVGVHEARLAYLNLLESSGWTEEQFNAETLRRVDAGWAWNPSPRGTHPMPASAGIPLWMIHISHALH